MAQRLSCAHVQALIHQKPTPDRARKGKGKDNQSGKSLTGLLEKQAAKESKSINTRADLRGQPEEVLQAGAAAVGGKGGKQAQQAAAGDAAGAAAVEKAAKASAKAAAGNKKSPGRPAAEKRDHGKLASTKRGARVRAEEAAAAKEKELKNQSIRVNRAKRKLGGGEGSRKVAKK